MPQPCINCAADAEIPNTFKLPGETDDQWIDRITGAQAAPAAVAEKRIAAIMALVDEFAGARAYAAQHPQVADASRYRDEVRAEVERSLRLVAAAPAAAQPVAGEPPEPLGWRVDWPGEGGQTWHQVFINEADALDKKLKHPGSVCSPLYTTPPALVGLSDEQIMHLWFAAEPTPDGRPASWNYARAVERAMAAANGMTLKEPAGKGGAA